MWAYNNEPSVAEVLMFLFDFMNSYKHRKNPKENDWKVIKFAIKCVYCTSKNCSINWTHFSMEPHQRRACFVYCSRCQDDLNHDWHISFWSMNNFLRQVLETNLTCSKLRFKANLGKLVQCEGVMDNLTLEFHECSFG